jgi:hypothetical protein
VKKKGEGYLVDTGPLRFSVIPRNFSLFDEVWLDGTLLVQSGGKIILTNEHGSFSPGNFTDTKVSIEEQTTRKVVLLVVGKNVKFDGSGYAMDYRIRIYAYADSPLIKVVYTIENRRGRWDQYVPVADWKIVLPTLVGGDLRYRFGRAGGNDVSGSLSDDSHARLDVTFTHNYVFSGSATGFGDPHEEEPSRLGTLDISGEKGGVTLAVRNFWQLWSKYLEVDAEGRLSVGLWTDRVLPKGDVGSTTLVDRKGQVQFFSGMARTQEIYFLFHSRDAEDPVGRLAGAAQAPLFACCEPSQYCQITRVWGDLAEADPSIYEPAWRPSLKEFNNWAEGSVRLPLERWKHDRHITYVDSYGLLNYGDGIEEKNDGEEPERVHWEGGYYDYPHSLYLQFGRTADPFYLWLAADMSRHNAEIHHTHHDQEPGRSRYCPSWAHIIMPSQVETDASGNVTCPGYYASGTFNHWKNWSAFDTWYLTGDHRSREAGLEISSFALRLGTDGISFGQPRSICHGSFGFYAAWEATGDQKFMESWQEFCRTTASMLERQKLGSGAWQRGMAMQGLCWYVERTGDESILPVIEKALDRDFDSNAAELAYAKAFFWKRTEEPKYFFAAVKHLRGTPESRWMQRFGNNGRSKLYVPWLVMKNAEPSALPPKP